MTEKKPTYWITLGDIEKLRKDLSDILYNNVDHHNEMDENFDHLKNYYLLNLKKNDC